MSLTKWIAAGVIGLAAAAILAPTASALTFRDPNYVGDYEFTLDDFSLGTLYGTPAIGTTYGGAAHNATNVADLDANDVSNNGRTSADADWPAAWALGDSEDTWGIARVTQISDGTGGLLWDYSDPSPAGGGDESSDDGSELIALFYGNEDHFFNVESSGTQTIAGAGTHIDFYEQPVGTIDWGAQASTDRIDLDEFTNITDTGTLAIQTVSAPGFLYPAGVAGGPDATFAVSFNPGNNSGSGSAYLDVVGGSLQGRFDTNQVSSALNTGADMKIQFTASVAGPSDPTWQLQSDDPVTGFHLPEPASVSLLLLAGLFGLARRRRRN